MAVSGHAAAACHSAGTAGVCGGKAVFARHAALAAHARRSQALQFNVSRGVAQPGSASALGAEGREFESLRPDHSVLAGPFSRKLLVHDGYWSMTAPSAIQRRSVAISASVSLPFSGMGLMSSGVRAGTDELDQQACLRLAGNDGDAVMPAGDGHGTRTHVVPAAVVHAAVATQAVLLQHRQHLMLVALQLGRVCAGGRAPAPGVQRRPTAPPPHPEVQPVRRLRQNGETRARQSGRNGTCRLDAPSIATGNPGWTNHARYFPAAGRSPTLRRLCCSILRGRTPVCPFSPCPDCRGSSWPSPPCWRYRR